MAQPPPHERASPPAAEPIDESNPLVSAANSSRRWLAIVAWSSGSAAAYALVGLVHAAAEGVLDVDVGFGRSLAFWVGTVYLALGLWGFLPRRPTAWYSRPRPLVAAGLLGAVGTIVCGGYTVAWLAAHWSAAIGTPVLITLLALAAMISLTMWIAGQEDA